MTTYSKSQLKAREYRAKALENLQAAQDHLSRVCAHLSVMSALTPEWELAAKLGDQIKALWWEVNQKRGLQIDLDEFGKKLLREQENIDHAKDSKSAK